MSSEKWIIKTKYLPSYLKHQVIEVLTGPDVN